MLICKSENELFFPEQGVFEKHPPAGGWFEKTTQLCGKRAIF